MLFSLVLAVASKEVELWQSFDDFAPRQLQEDMEELEGDLSEEDDERSEEDDEMSEGEEAGLNPLHVGLPVVGVAGLAGLYFMMNGGDSGENKGEEGVNWAELMKKVETGDPTAVCALLAASLAVTGGLAYALTGSAPPPSTSSGSKWLVPGAIGGAGALTLGYGVAAYKKGCFPFGETPTADTTADPTPDTTGDTTAEKKPSTTAEKKPSPPAEKKPSPPAEKKPSPPADPTPDPSGDNKSS